MKLIRLLVAVVVAFNLYLFADICANGIVDKVVAYALILQALLLCFCIVVATIPEEPKQRSESKFEPKIDSARFMQKVEGFTFYD